MTSLNFVEAYKPPQPPDYTAIKKSSDERIEAARQAAAALEAQRQAQAVRAVQIVSVQATGPADVIASITKWAGVYGVDPAWLLRVANCESGYNQAATNYSYYAGGGNPHGIFQFLPQTFYGNGGTDYNSYDDQARVAAHMFSIGQSVQWACK